MELDEELVEEEGDEEEKNMMDAKWNAAKQGCN